MNHIPSHRPVALSFQYVNGWNWWLARLAAFFVPVLAGKSYYLAKSHQSWMPAWCRNHDLVATLTHNDKRAFHEVAWRFFRRRLAGADQGVRYASAGLELNYGPLLLKAVADELNILAGLRSMARRLGLGRPVYFGTLVWPGFDGRADSFASVRLFHGLIRWCRELRSAFLVLGLQLFRLSLALFSPRREKPHADVLWFGAGMHEFNRFGEKACFYWPDRVGDKLTHAYILPRVPALEYRRFLASEKVTWVSRYHVLQFSGKTRLLLLGFRLMAAAAPIFLPWMGSLTLRARLCGLHFESLVWREVGESMGARAALTTSSNWPSPSPCLVALQHAGLKTAVWFYSANGIPFTHPGGGVHVHGKFRTVHEAQRIYVWSRHNETWLWENLCGSRRNEVVNIGPLMSGDARKCARPHPDAGQRLQIGVFDVTGLDPKMLGRAGAPHLSVEFQEAFWKDIGRLIEGYPESVFILKPKRSVRDPRRSFPDSFFNLLRDGALEKAGRVVFVEHDADPYEAVARCDLAIAMPFTSPCAAAWHFGKAGLYYDPIGMIGSHNYGKLGAYFCRSYESLESQVRKFALLKREGRTPSLPNEIRDFIGRSPGENPQAALLANLREWIWPAPRHQRTEHPSWIEEGVLR